MGEGKSQDEMLQDIVATVSSSSSRKEGRRGGSSAEGIRGCAVPGTLVTGGGDRVQQKDRFERLFALMITRLPAPEPAPLPAAAPAPGQDPSVVFSDSPASYPVLQLMQPLNNVLGLAGP